MPCIYIETSRFKDILAELPELPAHNWLISDLVCYDYCCWDGCEKWADRELFLTGEQLLRDVNLRNMQFIWGVFSAIPTEYSKEEIYKYPLPESEIPYYMSNHIVPQHPLAFLELYADDGSFTLVSSRDPAPLEPLYKLPYKLHDEEADNRVLNAQLRRIQDMLRLEVPDVSPEIANEVQWQVWYALFMNRDTPVADDDLRRVVLEKYQEQLASDRKCRNTFWNPYAQV